MYERAYGDKYERDLDIADIAKLVRKEIKAKLPAFKVSVRISRYSGGQSLNAEIKAVPPGFVINNPERVRLEEEDPNWVRQAGAYPIFSEEATKVEKTIKGIIEAYNYDGSEIQVDYFDVNFYSHVSWDFELKNQDKAKVLAGLKGEPEPEPKPKAKPKPSVTDDEVEELLAGLRKEPDTTFAVGELSRSRMKIAGWTGKVRSLVNKGILEVVEGRQAWNGAKLYRLTRTPERKAADDAEIEKARELGRKGFKNGLKASAQDPELNELLKGKKVGEGIPVLEAWNKGFTEANLAEPVPGVSTLAHPDNDPDLKKKRAEPVLADLGGPVFPAIKIGVC